MKRIKSFKNIFGILDRKKHKNQKAKQEEEESQSFKD